MASKLSNWYLQAVLRSDEAQLGEAPEQSAKLNKCEATVTVYYIYTYYIYHYILYVYMYIHSVLEDLCLASVVAKVRFEDRG